MINFVKYECYISHNVLESNNVLPVGKPVLIITKPCNLLAIIKMVSCGDKWNVALSLKLR